MPAKTPLKPIASVADNIRRYRLKAQKTQLELAHAIGFVGDDAGSYICRVENGKPQPSVATLRKIAVALKCRVSDLIS